MTLPSPLKLLTPLVKAFDHNTYHAPTIAQLRAKHMQQAMEAENFMVYNGTAHFPKVSKIDMPPLEFETGRRGWTSHAIRPAAYMRDVLRPGDRVVFREGRNGIDRLYMVYDHRLFLDTAQPLELLRAVSMTDKPYTGGFGLNGRYKDDWNVELLKPAPVAPPHRITR